MMVAVSVPIVIPLTSMLMGIAIKYQLTGLRRVGMAFLVLTIFKVFLYDLSNLTDLYRAASLFGLAVSLLIVSVVYSKWIPQLEEPKSINEA